MMGLITYGCVFAYFKFYYVTTLCLTAPQMNHESSLLEAITMAMEMVMVIIIIVIVAVVKKAMV